MQYKNPDSKTNFYPMCDLVIEFDDHAHLVEVKSRYGNMRHAANQLKHGRQWFKQYRHVCWEPYLTLVKYEVSQDNKELFLTLEKIWRPPFN